MTTRDHVILRSDHYQYMLNNLIQMEVISPFRDNVLNQEF